MYYTNDICDIFVFCSQLPEKLCLTDKPLTGNEVYPVDVTLYDISCNAVFVHLIDYNFGNFCYYTQNLWPKIGHKF